MLKTRHFLFQPMLKAIVGMFFYYICETDWIGKMNSQLNDLLRSAITAEGAVKGTIQRYRRETNELEIIASEGFTPEFLEHFKSVKPFDASCCGRAFGVGSTIIISDIEKDISFRPNLSIARTADFRAVKSVPIFGSEGQKLGVIATHFKEPKENWNTSKIDSILNELSRILETSLQRMPG